MMMFLLRNSSAGTLRRITSAVILRRRSSSTEQFSFCQHWHRDPFHFRSDIRCRVSGFIRLHLQEVHTKRREPWFDYSSKVFIEFMNKFDPDVSDKEKMFAELEVVLNKFEGRRNSTEYQIVNLMGIYEQADMTLDYMELLTQRGDLSLVLLKRLIEIITPHYPDQGLQLIHEYMDRGPKFMHLDFLITNLSYTKDWKYGVKLLKENSVDLSLKGTSVNKNKGSNSLFYVLLAALKNSDLAIYNELKKEYYFLHVPSVIERDMSKLLQQGVLTPGILLEILTNCIRGITYQQACRLKDDLERYWGNTVEIQFVNMADMADNSSVCPACGEGLMKPELTKQQLLTMEQDIIDHFMATDTPKHIFLKELNRLWDFIEEHGPFDIVVDTLNLLCGVHSKTLDEEGGLIKKEMREKFGISKPRVLFVTPNDRTNFNINESDCATFKSSLKRSDDWFVVLGALKSGQHTFFLSSDKYRDHFHWLDCDSFIIFLKWKSMKQINVHEHAFHIKDRVLLSKPKPFINLPSETASGWHIPFSNPTGPGGSSVGLLSLPEIYMCIRKLDKWKPSS